jgi:hypothetical protein
MPEPPYEDRSSAGHTPVPHVPTEAEILDALRRHGVTDIQTLATKIATTAREEADSDEPATDSIFIWRGDSYVYIHVSAPTTVDPNSG